jgi:hypothetical protein
MKGRKQRLSPDKLREHFGFAAMPDPEPPKETCRVCGRPWFYLDERAVCAICKATGKTLTVASGESLREDCEDATHKDRGTRLSGAPCS